jgi:phosphomannomutase
LPFSFIKVHHEPDGHFPNGIPNPMLEENRAPTVAAILEHRADFGIAWDGDFDRCFFFDETGAFIEGYYIVGLLASVLLRGHAGGNVVHDPRLTWNTIEVVKASGGTSVLSKSGHAFIKQRMREVDGVYGGEMSAHHYFRRFAYCDSGMIPWLIVAQILCESGLSLSKLVGERIALFPVSGELNYRVPDAKATIGVFEARYAALAEAIDRTDGVSFEFPAWRFNLRSSNTEPLIRLNVEARGSVHLMREKTAELLALLESQGAVAADS